MPFYVYDIPVLIWPVYLHMHIFQIPDFGLRPTSCILYKTYIIILCDMNVNLYYISYFIHITYTLYLHLCICTNIILEIFSMPIYRPLPIIK